MKTQAFTTILEEVKGVRDIQTVNHPFGALNLSKEILLAVTDDVSRGLEVMGEEGEEPTFLSPVRVCKNYILPALEELHHKQHIPVSTRVRFEGDTHIASLKISANPQGLCKHQVDKRVARVVWNYTWVSDSNMIVSFYIGTRKGRNK